MRKTDLRINGRLVYIDYESGAPKASFRTQDGRQWLKQDEAAATKRQILGGKSGNGKAGGSERKGKEGKRFEVGRVGKGMGQRHKRSTPLIYFFAAILNRWWEPIW